MNSPLGTPVGRIPVTKVSPVLEGGAYPAKASVGERIPITARVFRDGHDLVGAHVILTNPHGQSTRIDMTQIWPMGLDIWRAEVVCDEVGPWTFRVEAYADEWNTWRHHAAARLGAEVDVELVCLEGRDLCTRTLADMPADVAAAATITMAHDLLDPARSTLALRETATHDDLDAVMTRYAPRSMISPTPDYPLFCDRELARFSAWYEFFPRSIGATYDADTDTWTSGTFATAKAGLRHAANLGFDVVYLPPIHPIGSAFKKGKNNTLASTENDPGSPWAIGSAAGGHEAIHPDLGTVEDFEDFVAEARSLGLEVAIDLVMNASPDHPWATEHPQWFHTRLDGTTAYAENPPKKYQDVYPFNFDTDPSGISVAIHNLVKLWISRGVTIFRVDNPHTKPAAFWAWLIAKIRKKHPEVIFLAEAFTRPEMTRMLGVVGFQQSYTYFTWRNTKAELTEYLTELAGEQAEFFRPNFFTNTPDINPVFTQDGTPAAFAIRAMLAATMSPSWGMYSGFELFEHELFRTEEYLNSEKYEYRPRNFDAEPNMNEWVASLNRVRREHPALQQLRDITFHQTTSDEVIAFSKKEGDDVVLVVCSLNPHSAVDAWITFDGAGLGLGTTHIRATDVLSGEQVEWDGAGWVGLNPIRVGQIFSIDKA